MLSSEQDLVSLFTLTHPMLGSQESSVQVLWSLQFRYAPGTQTPAEQRSNWVQALPSEHGFPVEGVWLHPVPGSHRSTVQALPSLQSALEVQEDWPRASATATIRTRVSANRKETPGRDRIRSPATRQV